MKRFMLRAAEDSAAADCLAAPNIVFAMAIIAVTLYMLAQPVAALSVEL